MQEEEIIYIKNMITPRDILAVNHELERLGLQVKQITLGTAAFIKSPKVTQEILGKAMEEIGFPVLERKDQEFVEQVKSFIASYLEQPFGLTAEPLLSEYLETKLGMPYARISRRFRKIENRTIENFFVGIKIDKVKSLIQNTNMSIEDIAQRVKYSSPKSLAKTFKEATGFSLHHYTRRKDKPAYSLTSES